MKFLQGRTRLDFHESQKDLLQPLDHMHGNLKEYDSRTKNMDHKLVRIEYHLDIQLPTD